MPNEVRDNPEKSRCEMAIGDAVAFIEYRWEDDWIVLTHTDVPEALSGQGVGSKLVRAVLDRLRADGARVESRCQFVTAFVKRHPEYRNWLAERGRPAEPRGSAASGVSDENMEVIARQDRERGAWGIDEA